MFGPLVSTEWLQSSISDPSLVVLDASLNSTIVKGKPASTHANWQIPGSRVFDIDGTFCDKTSRLPHMMPSEEVFVRGVRELGIDDKSKVVIYDRLGIYSSPRARWMFKAMGHDNVAVLNGGFPAWVRAGLPIEGLNAVKVPLGSFVAKPYLHLFCEAEDIIDALTDVQSVVLDARSMRRVLGLDPEPREALRLGHMPNALNLPFEEVLSNGEMKSTEDLVELFKPLLRLEQKLFTTCGSGVTACIVAFAAELIGHASIFVYDGSWCEWGQPSELPVTTE